MRLMPYLGSVWTFPSADISIIMSQESIKRILFFPLAVLLGCLVGGSSALIFVSSCYRGELESGFANPMGEDAQCTAVFAKCNIEKGTRITRRMLGQRKILAAKCPANVLTNIWSAIGKRCGYSVLKGDYIGLNDVSVPYSDN